MSQYAIVEDPPEGQKAFTAYGGGREIWQYRGHEIMVSGPAETGKTRTCLEKLDALMWKYPGAQAAIVRKTRVSMTGSVLQTYEKKVLTKDSPVVKYGGSQVDWYTYPNGSRIFVGGMDHPEKVLSSERDFIYVNQSEELNDADWETLTTRCTGRAGNTPYAQIFGDCNPGASNHWILGRGQTGKLKIVESRHEDNPTLFDPVTHEITEQGTITLEILDGLTGVRYRRLRLGQWASAEGAVYEEWDKATNLIEPFPIPREWTRIRVIDFGYTNPFTTQWWAIDGDGRMYLYREIYFTRRLVEDHARQINTLDQGESITATIADHDAEDRATLAKYGIETVAASKAVQVGIQAVQSRLRKVGDGKPRLFVMKGALVEADPALISAHKPYSTEQEWEGYVWKKSGDGRPNKEEPDKRDDHGMDAARYAVMYVDGNAGTETSESPVVDDRSSIPNLGIDWDEGIPGF